MTEVELEFNENKDIKWGVEEGEDVLGFLCVEQGPYDFAPVNSLVLFMGLGLNTPLSQEPDEWEEEKNCLIEEMFL